MNAILKVGGYLFCLLLPCVAGCTPGMTDKSQCIRHRLEEYDPADRIRAIRDTVDLGDESLIPALVDRLDDEDAAVRFYAIMALEKLTKTRRGYSYSDPATKRREAIDNWRKWVTANADATQKKSEIEENPS